MFGTLPQWYLPKYLKWWKCVCVVFVWWHSLSSWSCSASGPASRWLAIFAGAAETDHRPPWAPLAEMIMFRILRVQLQVYQVHFVGWCKHTKLELLWRVHYFPGLISLAPIAMNESTFLAFPERAKTTGNGWTASVWSFGFQGFDILLVLKCDGVGGSWVRPPRLVNGWRKLDLCFRFEERKHGALPRRWNLIDTKLLHVCPAERSHNRDSFMEDSRRSRPNWMFSFCETGNDMEWQLISKSHYVLPRNALEATMFAATSSVTHNVSDTPCSQATQGGNFPLKYSSTRIKEASYLTKLCHFAPPPLKGEGQWQSFV